MNRILMKSPIVEMDGDEMTRVMWAWIKEELLEPFVELKTEYYDLGLPSRDQSSDQITVDAAEAVRRLKVGVKCATITPNTQRMEEYHLHKLWKSPNATLRSLLDGTVFRTPIVLSTIRPVVKTWEKPITIARHAYGDVYKNVEIRTQEAGKCELVFTGKSGEKTVRTVQELDGPGVFQGMHNKEQSIENFVRSVFSYALDTQQDVWFSAKDTISKTYDGAFREIFQHVYETEYQQAFETAGLTYFYTLIDDAVARVIRSRGGFIWALKNYDGDVMSDMVSTAFGSLAMMTSVLVSPSGCYEYEAAHGTVTRHYYRYQQGEKTSTNPIATIFAWTGALRKRAQLDSQPELQAFSDRLEKTCLNVLEEGIVTRDLAALSEEELAKKGLVPRVVDTQTFLKEVRQQLSDT